MPNNNENDFSGAAIPVVSYEMTEYEKDLLSRVELALKGNSIAALKQLRDEAVLYKMHKSQVVSQGMGMAA
jgi:hypothetical protein